MSLYSSIPIYYTTSLRILQGFFEKKLKKTFFKVKNAKFLKNLLTIDTFRATIINCIIIANSAQLPSGRNGEILSYIIIWEKSGGLGAFP